MNLRISIVIGIIIVITIYFYRYNYSLGVEAQDDAKAGEYSESGNYVNITPMKHDIFKQLTLDALVFFVLWLMIEVIGGMESFFDWKDFFDSSSFTKFRLSIFGQSFFSVIGFMVYYQIIEPQIVNRINKF